MTDSRTQDISDIIKPLSSRQMTGIEPSRHGQEVKNVQLDILARVLTWKNDTCIALCLWEGKLLVASNRGVPSKSVEEDLAKLRHFFCGKDSRERNLSLLRSALEKSCDLMTDKISKILSERLIRNNRTRQRCLEEFFNLSRRHRGTTINIERIKSLVSRIFQIAVELRRENNISLSNSVWDFVSPIDDVNKIIKFVHGEELDLLLLNSIIADDVILVESEENIHAEMKIVDYIFDSVRRMGHTKQEYFYIGIGKLCCLPCQKVVDVINWFNRFRIGVPGTHGKTYNWKLLKSFRTSSRYDNEYNGFRQELERIKNGEYANFVRESTCYFPENLTSFVLEETFTVQQQQHP